MINVESTIRMNQLSKDLKQRGFADDSLEAIRQAGMAILKDPEENNILTGTDPQMKSEQFYGFTKQLTELQMKFDRLGSIIQGRIEHLEKINEEFRVKMNEMIKEINCLQTIRASTTENTRGRGNTQPQIAGAPAPASTTPEKSGVTDKPIDRNGVAPGDVSIDKMFYCGNKRF